MHIGKYIVNITLAVFLLLLCCGKSYGQLMGGIGVSYGDDIQQSAPNLRLYYFPNHKICFGPEFAYFYSRGVKWEEKELIEYGFSGHYIFPLTEKLAFYPLLGLNYAIEKEIHLDFVEEIKSFGANIGAGFHLEYGRYFPFAEYKYVASGLAQNVLSIGVLVNFKKPKKESHEPDTH